MSSPLRIAPSRSPGETIPAEQLFVYGTLCTRSGSPAAALLRHCQRVAQGSIMARLYEVDGYPGAVASTTPQERVFGEVYRVDDPEQLFPLLDAYEECTPGFPVPHEYRRTTLPVTLAAGDTLSCWVYLYNRDVSALRRLASGRYHGQGSHGKAMCRVFGG